MFSFHMLAPVAPVAALSLAASASLLTGCSAPAGSAAGAPEKVALADSAAANSARVALRLTRFDSLDFDVYSNQKWNQLHVSHAPNILVHYPDGHTTTGLAAHIDELKPIFALAPDTKIKTHSVKFGTGEWTSVIGEMEGTFTKPMALSSGKFVPPTGKHFKFSMVTVGRWQGGQMVEEFLMWDNAGFMKQIGLGQ